MVLRIDSPSHGFLFSSAFSNKSKSLSTPVPEGWEKCILTGVCVFTGGRYPKSIPNPDVGRFSITPIGSGGGTVPLARWGYPHQEHQVEYPLGDRATQRVLAMLHLAFTQEDFLVFWSKTFTRIQ